MKKTTTFTIIVISILLIGLYTVTSTYSVIIDVIENNGIAEIVNEINIKDLLINDDGTYNDTYYIVRDELELTEEEATLLMNSTYLNESLKVVLESIVEYKVHNNIDAKLSDNAIYDLICQSIIDDDNLSDDLKSRVINSASTYRDDISEYVYDIEVSVHGDNVWNYT